VFYEYASSRLYEYRKEIKKRGRQPEALLDFLDQNCEPRLGALINLHPQKDQLIDYLTGRKPLPQASRARKAPHTWVAAELAVQRLRERADRAMTASTFLENYVHARKVRGGRASRARKSSGPKPPS